MAPSRVAGEGICARAASAIGEGFRGLTPHPPEFVERAEQPSPARGEGTNGTILLVVYHHARLATRSRDNGSLVCPRRNRRHDTPTKRAIPC